MKKLLIIILLACSSNAYSQIRFTAFASLLDKDFEGADSILTSHGFTFLSSEKDGVSYSWAHEPSTLHTAPHFVTTHFNENQKMYMVFLQTVSKYMFDDIKNTVKKLGFYQLPTISNSLGVAVSFTDKKYTISFMIPPLEIGKSKNSYYITIEKSDVTK
jgi:hypothetical protein